MSISCRVNIGEFLFLVALCGVTVAEARVKRELVESYSASDEPVTIPYNVSLIPGSEDLPYNHPRIVPKVHDSAPEQVCIFLLLIWVPFIHSFENFSVSKAAFRRFPAGTETDMVSDFFVEVFFLLLG